MPVTYEQNKEVYQKIVSSIINTSKNSPAIFCKGDDDAISLIKAAIDLNIDIPNQLGIMGFGDSAIAKICPIPLSTFRQNYEGIGRSAASMMLKLLEKGEKGEKHHQTQLISGRIMPRYTTK